MDRAGKQANPLTPDEMRTIFELASSGRGRGEALQRLAVRNRTTINRAYNVAVEFELRETTSLDDATADQIAKAAKYGLTVTRVKDLFLQWRMWKSRNDPKDLTHVRAEAALTHVGRLGKVAEEFETQLYLPRAHDGALGFLLRGSATELSRSPLGAIPLDFGLTTRGSHRKPVRACCGCSRRGFVFHMPAGPLIH